MGGDKEIVKVEIEVIYLEFQIEVGDVCHDAV